MATHPDPSEIAEYPASLSGLLEVARDFPKEDLGVRVPDPDEVANGEDYNKVARNLFALSEDLRDFIIEFGLDPDDFDDMLDTAVAIKALIGEGGGGGPGGSGGPTELIFKTADQSVINNDSTPVDDTELRFDIAEGEKFVGSCIILYQGTEGEGELEPEPGVGIRYTMQVGSGTPELAKWFPGSFPTEFGQTGIGGGADGLLAARFDFIIDNTGGDDTEVKFQFYQWTEDSGPNPNDPVVVKAGSTLIAWRDGDSGGGGGAFPIAIQRGSGQGSVGYVAPNPGAMAFGETELIQASDNQQFTVQGLHPLIGDFNRTFQLKAVLASPWLFDGGSNKVFVRIEGTLAGTLSNIIGAINDDAMWGFVTETYFIATNPSGNILRIEIQALTSQPNGQAMVIDFTEAVWSPPTPVYSGGADSQNEIKTPVTVFDFTLEVPSSGPTALLGSRIKSGEQGAESVFTVTGDPDIVDEGTLAFTDFVLGTDTVRAVFIEPAEVEASGTAIVSWTWGDIEFEVSVTKFVG